MDELRGGSATEAGSDRWALRNGAHLCTLWAFAVARPTFDVLSQGADLFVTRKVDGVVFVAACLIFTFLPPLVMLATEALVDRSRSAWRERLHLFFVWGLLALFALFALKRTFPTAGLELFVGAVIVASLATALYVRSAAAQSFVSVLTPAPLVFLVLFLFFSPSKGLIFPKDLQESAEASGSEAPVVMVVFDELPISSLMDRRGEIDATRYPNFARLAEQSTWFRNVATVADQTEDAVPAIVSGNRSTPDEIATFTDHPENLFTLLAGDHDVTALEHATWLCPSAICAPEFGVPRRTFDVLSAMALVYAHTIVPARYELKLPAVGRTAAEALSSEDPRDPVDIDDASNSELARHPGAQFEAFLQMIEPQDRGDDPPFYFLHSSLPHIPWNYLPSGKLYAGLKDVPPGLSESLATWGPDRYLVAHSFQRHLLQTMFVDRLLGSLLRQLRDQGLYRRSTLIVTADHGVSFTPGGQRRSIGEPNAADVALIPFFVKPPGQVEPRVVNTPIETIDELPTVADMVGIDLPWQTEGVSALSSEYPNRDVVDILRHRDGATVPVAFDLMLRQRERTLRRQDELFGTGTGSDFYGFGRFSDLWGRDVASLPSAPATDVSATIEAAGDYAAVDPSSPYTPALVSGVVTGTEAPDVSDLAVAIDGRIVAVAPTYSFEGTRFSVMVPGGALRSGENLVELYAVEQVGGRERLALLGGTAG